MVTKQFTQREVAKLAGVSYPTVNRALSGSARVSPKLREHILQVAQSVGYRKNLAARSLSTKRTHAIGLIGLNDPLSYWAEVTMSLEQGARDRGYHIVVCHRDEDPMSTSAPEISFMLERQVDGLILVPNSPYEDPAIFNTVANAGVPLLFLTELVTGVSGHYLGSDSREGAREACQYLLEMGHRRICHVAAPQGYYTARCRKEGYVAAMRSAGLEVTEDMIVETEGWGLEDGEAVVQKILAMSPRPTAIFTANDPLAITLSLGLREAGVRIPQDISLIGYAGMKEGSFLSPPLTSVGHPTFSLGKQAVQLMVELIEGECDKPVFKELPDKLLIRKSCAPPTSSYNEVEK